MSIRWLEWGRGGRSSVRKFQREIPQMSAGTRAFVQALGDENASRVRQLLNFRNDLDLSGEEVKSCAAYSFDKACRDDRRDMMQSLLGAGPGLITNDRGRSMLDYLISQGRTEAAQVVVTARPELLVEPGLAGTPVETALLMNRPEMALTLTQLLIDHSEGDASFQTLCRIRESLLPASKRTVYELISAKLQEPQVTSEQEPQEPNCVTGPFVQAILDEKSATQSRAASSSRCAVCVALNLLAP